MNRLGHEASPYLRQHADNPVDWYPWGEEAFARARDDDKPVLLSVGYSACHWCHVMAHESFEDDATAAVMNELFVNIKVDREERPDVDSVYMDAVQALVGHGGWPMTVFLAPDGRPFWAGTYFPPTPRHGMPSFVEVLRAVHDAWTSKREDLLGQAEEVTRAVQARSGGGFGRGPVAVAADLDDPLAVGVEMISANHDDRLGGFGGAPKFPQPSMVDLLLLGAHGGDDQASARAILTLDAMASGGIYDHLGGGFARYSVDDRWLVPHFEKMLYDQAGFISVYTHAALLTGEPRFAQVVRETITYVLRDLRLDGGGLASAEDADSEGHEGLFQTWTQEELRAVLGSGEDADAVLAWYGVRPGGNFEGRSILFRPERGDLVRPPAIESARAALFEVRERRVRPGRDDKVVTEWNAMTLGALAEAGAAFGEQSWIDAAVEIAEFLVDNLRDATGRWHRAWQAEAGARHLAVGADYAAVVDAFTRLSEASGQARWIAEALRAADALLELFWDDDGGGILTVGRDAEALVANPKETFDGATPSTNSTAALGLARLAALTGETRYEARATSIAAALPLHQHPGAFTPRGVRCAPAGTRHHRSRDPGRGRHRRRARRRVPRGLASDRGTGVGRALRERALGGESRGQRLRVSPLRLRCADHRSRRARRAPAGRVATIHPHCVQQDNHGRAWLPSPPPLHRRCGPSPPPVCVCASCFWRRATTTRRVSTSIPAASYGRRGIRKHRMSCRSACEHSTSSARARTSTRRCPIRHDPKPSTLDAAPVAVGKLRGRRAERLLRPLHHPERGQLLGFAGPAVPYWTLAGDRPSMTVVAPHGPVVLAPTEDGLVVRFTWRAVLHSLPCTDPAALAAVKHARGRAVRAPRRLLVTLSEPYLGHCYKLVPALLPA